MRARLIEVCNQIGDAPMHYLLKSNQEYVQPKLTTVRMCQTAPTGNKVCNTNIKTKIMKNKLFVLGLFLMAFTFLYAANSPHLSKKKAEAAAPATPVEIHPLIVPLEAF
jgi:hypothetical protein